MWKESRSPDSRHDVAKYGVILCGFIFKPELTIEYLEKKGLQDSLITSLLENSSQYNQAEYSQKVKLRTNSAILLRDFQPFTSDENNRASQDQDIQNTELLDKDLESSFGLSRKAQTKREDFS